MPPRATREIEHWRVLDAVDVARDQTHGVPRLAKVAMLVDGEIFLADQSSNQSSATVRGSAARMSCHLWYGSPRMRVPARYSCSARTRRASSWGSVHGASWIERIARERTSSGRPNAPPITNARSWA